MSDKNQRINHLIGASLDKLDGLADVNTIIGKPIVTASGYQVIPFSKVTLSTVTVNTRPVKMVSPLSFFSKCCMPCRLSANKNARIYMQIYH